MNVAGHGAITYDTFESGTTPAPPEVNITTPSPITINEGAGVSITATVTLPSSTDSLAGPVLWDISGRGAFGEASGSTITLTWQQLEAFGITGPGTYQAEATDANGLTAAEAGNETVQGWTVNWVEGTTATFGASVLSATHALTTPVASDQISVTLSDSYSVAQATATGLLRRPRSRWSTRRRR